MKNDKWKMEIGKSAASFIVTKVAHVRNLPLFRISVPKAALRASISFTRLKKHYKKCIMCGLQASKSALQKLH